MPTRRSFLQSTGAALLALAGGSASSAPSGTYDAFEKTLSELQADLTAGRTSAAELVAFYLRRIVAYDQAGPSINAVLFVNPRALADARALDEERRRRGPRGPLHGIPVLLKDNFDTKDMPTTAGCLGLSRARPAADAFQVRRLRQAGAVMLGKANLHELALGLTTFSSLGGQTLDPYDLTRAPGGSSGGSGAATAANFAAFTMGTDTSGSIRIPSSHNSIVGLRPSAGLSSRAGIVPFGHTQDTGGPMARCVADIALVLDSTVGYDASDPITGTAAGKIPRTYTSSLDHDALRGARIGVLTEFFGTAPEDQEVGVIVRGAVDEMKRAGATAVDIALPDLPARLAASNLLFQELGFYLGEYLKTAPGSAVSSIDDLLTSGLHSAQLRAILENARAQPADYLASDDYRRRLAARVSLGSAVVKLMDDDRLDAIAYPTTRRTAPAVGGNQIGSNAALSAQTGFPAITVPAGFTQAGFPVGLELLGRQFGEPTLIALAFSYEQATRHRRAPANTPRLGEPVPARPVATTADAAATRLLFIATATGSQSVPPSGVTFRVAATFKFDARSRSLDYELVPSGAADQIGGVYLHRRGGGPNGGVVCVLAKSLKSRAAGSVQLSEPEAADLEAGKCYVSAVSRRSPRLSARANLVVA
jgi:Asp-tRNA(Asn)/Glu-tRNA(Gln) amidotransferase A subunit family amidase